MWLLSLNFLMLVVALPIVGVMVITRLAHTSVRRLRQASRLFADRERALTRDDLITIEETDVRASRVGAAERRVLVPHEPRLMPQDAHGVDAVLVAIGSGKLQDDEIHSISKR